MYARTNEQTTDRTTFFRSKYILANCKHDVGDTYKKMKSKHKGKEGKANQGKEGKGYERKERREGKVKEEKGKKGKGREEKGRGGEERKEMRTEGK